MEFGTTIVAGHLWVTAAETQPRPAFPPELQKKCVIWGVESFCWDEGLARWAAMKVPMPRDLNEPEGCVFSSFR